MTWNDDQAFEKNWWGQCLITYGEETKQLTYAHRMGLVITPDPDEKWPLYELDGKSVLDIGGGPTSMLLKTRGGHRLTVVDPCTYPEWVQHRYDEAGIEYRQMPAEEFDGRDFSEIWIYNCLQHTMDPERIIKNARQAGARGAVIRIYETIDLPACLGHPQELKRELLDEWLGGTGTIEQMNENTCYGTGYYGVFPC